MFVCAVIVVLFLFVSLDVHTMTRRDNTHPSTSAKYQFDRAIFLARFFEQFKRSSHGCTPFTNVRRSVLARR